MGISRALNGRMKMMIIVWLGIYPTVLVAMLALRPYTANLPLALQVLILTVVVVPVAFLIAIPALQRLLSGWLASGSNR
jgi:antibiotic biosynthesis monooxygenase (ABM) superfamily enzyme